jgi:hypothetical protein
VRFSMCDKCCCCCCTWCLLLLEKGSILVPHPAPC